MLDLNGFKSPPKGTTLAEQTIYLMERILVWRSEIEDALEHAGNSYMFNDVVAMTMQGQLKFFEFDECFCFCQISIFPQFKTWHFFIAGGNLEGIRSKKLLFKEIAKENDCKYMSFSGKKGFMRALQNDGWKLKFVTMYTEVDE